MPLHSGDGRRPLRRLRKSVRRPLAAPGYRLTPGLVVSQPPRQKRASALDDLCRLVSDVDATW